MSRRLGLVSALFPVAEGVADAFVRAGHHDGMERAGAGQDALHAIDHAPERLPRVRLPTAAPTPAATSCPAFGTVECPDPVQRLAAGRSLRREVEAACGLARALSRKVLPAPPG